MVSKKNASEIQNQKFGDYGTFRNTRNFIIGKRSLFESTMRLIINPKKRKPWSELFYSNNIENSLTKNTTGKYSEMIESVRLAPSSINSQPWRIVKENETFHFYKKSISKLCEKKKLHNVDMGIAMCHFELSAKENGINGKWIKKKPDIGVIPEKTEYIISWIEV